MSRRRSVAHACWSLSLALSVLNIWLLTRNWDTQSAGGLTSSSVELVTGVAYVSLATIGAMLVVRRRHNRVGWVFLTAGLMLTAAAFASEYATYAVLTAPGSLPAVPLVTWLGAWIWWAGACLAVTFGLMLYPDGSLPSARWRGVAGAAAANLVVLTLLHALAPGPLDGEYSMVVNPVGVDSATALRQMRDAGWLLLTVNAAIAVAALLSRSRAATPEQRRQLQWLVIPAATAVVAAPLWGLTSAGERSASTATQATVLIAVFGTPLAVAVALRRATSLSRSVERLVLAREEERRRIRRDLHDGLGPTLAGVALQLDAARTLIRHDPAKAEAVLEGLVDQVKVGIADVRRVIDDLRPPVLDQLGLVSAIQQGTSYLNRRSGGEHLEVSVETAGTLGNVPPAIEVTAFRIVMEAVTNTSRHAQASRCTVRLVLDGALDIAVEDDGRGLPRDYVAGVGLTSMRERAEAVGGTCAVEPRPEGGTVVRARLPVD